VRRPGAETVSPNAGEGRRLSQLHGCIACHSIDSTSVSTLGPSWKGLYGSQRTLAHGAGAAVANDAYLREAILEPTAKTVAGYERGETGMPSYAGVLTDQQIASIVEFIKSLK
jgi:mono/diheme cytochrome c family protein